MVSITWGTVQQKWLPMVSRTDYRMLTFQEHKKLTVCKMLMKANKSVNSPTVRFIKEKWTVEERCCKSAPICDSSWLRPNWFSWRTPFRKRTKWKVRSACTSRTVLRGLEILLLEIVSKFAFFMRTASQGRAHKGPETDPSMSRVFRRRTSGTSATRRGTMGHHDTTKIWSAIEEPISGP